MKDESYIEETCMCALDPGCPLHREFGTQWISVDDCLPGQKQPVIVAYYKVARTAYLQGGIWRDYWDDDRLSGITHWHPLPKPPDPKAENGS